MQGVNEWGRVHVWKVGTRQVLDGGLETMSFTVSGERQTGSAAGSSEARKNQRLPVEHGGRNIWRMLR